MIYEFTYSFKELTLNKDYLSAMLGFPDGILPEPFDEYVAEGFKQAEKLCEIRGAFCFSENNEFTPDKNTLILNEIAFRIGKTVAKELKNSINFALFICTAGHQISHQSQNLLTGENPVLGYVLDVLGTMIVESATDLLQIEIKRIAAEKDMQITNRYSPGFCKWSVADQHKLFFFFPMDCCGIYLTDSALMNPVKSVSGIIGMGKEVKFREYTCNLCSQNDCLYRNIQLKKLID
jgi:hypothetical protein